MELAEALPQAPEAQASQQQTIDPAQAPEDETKLEGEAAPELTPEQTRIKELERELVKKQRGIDRQTRKAYEWRARAEQGGLTRTSNQVDNQNTADDSEVLSLTRAELEQKSLERARQLAPTLARQALEVEQQAKTVESLQRSVGGPEKFVELTNELAEVFDAQRQLAVLQAANPAALLKYLTDADNADEAEEIGRLDAISAGRRLAQIEAKLAATSKADTAPKASKAPAPLEAIRGRGPAGNGMPPPSNAAAWIAWRNAEERAGRA